MLTMKRPNTRSKAGGSQLESEGSQELSLNSHQSIYVTREETERMMKKMQDKMITRQQKMLEGFLQRCDNKE